MCFKCGFFMRICVILVKMLLLIGLRRLLVIIGVVFGMIRLVVVLL